MKTTPFEKLIIELYRLNKSVGTEYVYRHEFSVGRFRIKIEQRRKKNLWGRFGGGWDLKFGFQCSRSTIIFTYFVGTILIEKRSKNDASKLD